jgi:nicotinate-nucleotide--dimethylbenzimidazole phosphoribosyltransferase
MQRVPVDPQAGPVQAPKPAPVNTATQAPRPLQPQVAEAAHAEPHAEAPKPFSSQPLPPPAAPVKAAENKPAPAAAAPVKAAPVAVAKVAPPKPVETASASVTLRLAPPLKGESDKPAQPPKVLPPTPVKAVANKDAVPGLRISASAY